MPVKNNIHKIAQSIQAHRKDEYQKSKHNIGVARAECVISSATTNPRDYILWLTNVANNPLQLHTTEMTISKNSKAAGVIIQGRKGSHRFNGPMGRIYTIDIDNFTDYTPIGNTAKDLTLYIEGDDDIYTFRTLQEMLDNETQLRHQLIKQMEKQKQLEKEKEEAIRKEESAIRAAKRAKEEEKLRLEEEARKREEERREKEEEEQRQKEEIERLEADIRAAQERVSAIRNFIRGEVSLRTQHILDPYQEVAKRSHFYDGVPIVIVGGPGTGKTTTMIQRLKFLLDKSALEEYDSPLTVDQKKQLTDDISFNWLFFSPTPLLLRFLMRNMNEEGLSAVEGKNIVTIDDFRKDMLGEYHLFNMDTDGPFKSYKKSKNAPLIYAPQTAIAEFEKFCVSNLKKILLNAGTLHTEKFSWHKESLGIKAYCLKAAKITDLEALMRLFNSMQDNEQKTARLKDGELSDLLQRKALELQRPILEDTSMRSEINSLFNKWDAERLKEQNPDIEEDEMDDSDENEESESITMLGFETRLFKYLKTFIRRLALTKIETKTKLTPRQRAFADIIQPLTTNLELSQIGELAFFSKKYSILCKGIERNILNQIPRLYKVYRKTIINSTSSSCYNIELLKKIIDLDENKHLHFDEQDLLIGFINNLAMDIRRRSKERYEKLRRNKYIKAYEANKKPVIGIDEATDYSVMDYYMMYSFRNYDYSAVTLSGDIMQGLNANGIRAWSEVKKVIPNLDVFELKVSYRQIPTLVEMSRSIYMDDQGELPPYNSRNRMVAGEPKPLVLVSDDEDKKIGWIVKRLREVYLAYGKEIPSVGIFIPNGNSVDKFVKRLNDEDELGEIKIAAGSETNVTKAVKVYELNEVKGMEFEVVFFYDLDKALVGDDKDMITRYLYVGISRATSHLAATFSQKDGNEDVLKYFDSTSKNWMI